MNVSIALLAESAIGQYSVLYDITASEIITNITDNTFAILIIAKIDDDIMRYMIGLTIHSFTILLCCLDGDPYRNRNMNNKVNRVG